MKSKRRSLRSLHTWYPNSQTPNVLHISHISPSTPSLHMNIFATPPKPPAKLPKLLKPPIAANGPSKLVLSYSIPPRPPRPPNILSSPTGRRIPKRERSCVNAPPVISGMITSMNTFRGFFFMKWIKSRRRRRRRWNMRRRYPSRGERL
jgi:hypothetical protein